MGKNGKQAKEHKIVGVWHLILCNKLVKLRQGNIGGKGGVGKEQVEMPNV
jgi:hypothetical protein